MMGKANGLCFGRLGDTTLHLCVDMQAMFALPTPWHAPWMEQVLPGVERIVWRDPARTLFTRFVPPRAAAEAEGVWRRYYEHWHTMTLGEIDPGMVELLAPLRRFAPPAEVFDKSTYSPWIHGNLDARLRHRGIDTLVVTGGETDVCALGAVLGAVDRGYRVIAVADALCSASDEAHDATLRLYRSRYGLQVEVATASEVLDAWA